MQSGKWAETRDEIFTVAFRKDTADDFSAAELAALAVIDNDDAVEPPTNPLVDQPSSSAGPDPSPSDSHVHDAQPKRERGSKARGGKHVQALRAIEVAAGMPLPEYLRSNRGEKWARRTLEQAGRIISAEQKGHAVKVLDLFVMRDYDALLDFLNTDEGLSYSRWLVTKDRSSGGHGY